MTLCEFKLLMTDKRLNEVDDLCVCVRPLSYLGSQTALLDLWDVGVSRVQCVEIHFAELVVELLSKLPGKIIVAVEK